MVGDELNRALMVTIHHMHYPITIKALHQVFSPHGFVQKIVTFQKSAGRNIYDDCCQLDIQFYGVCATIQGLCAGENVIGTSLAVPQTSVFKYENSDGDGGVALMVLIDTNKYPVVLKNKLHQACVTIALFLALTVKVKGSFVQVENQVLQLDPMFKVPPVLEQGEPDAGILVVSTTQKMLGT
ncbi:WD repeat and FYVE domain-containing protein 3 [Gossypium australe]|uniref:WD repeat and FYVE domain-containing protein 3 n=1 Tax=Gossypium australe TaxID=47621 RepID=A0A5B6W8T3_9ROSI|nr:WD repeat and FYVE domain-containing protein 3 [Gossypium australe]